MGTQQYMTVGDHDIDFEVSFPPYYITSAPLGQSSCFYEGRVDGGYVLLFYTGESVAINGALEVSYS